MATGATAGSSPIINSAGGGTLTIGTLGITPVAGFTSTINSGTGTLKLGGGVTFTAATTGQAAINGNLDLNGGQTFTINNGTGAGFDVTIGAIISNGTLTKAGAGTLQLTGATLTYRHLTTINAGTLQFKGANALPSATAISLAGATLQVLNDGTGNNGTITLGNTITLSAAVTATISVGNSTANTGNTVAFGALNNGTSANAFASTINFTGANSYLESFSSLGLSGLTGFSTTLNPTTTSVTITGNVTNQESGTVTGHFDTLILDGTSAGNAINGIISDAAGFVSVGNGDTRVTKQNTSTWTLAGANTYHGPTAINAGALRLTNANAVQNSDVTLNAGTLQLRGDADTTFAASSVTIGAFSNTYTIDVNQLTGAGSNHTLGFATTTLVQNVTSLGVTGGNGYTLTLGNTHFGNSNPWINPTTASVAITSAIHDTESNVARNFILDGTSTGNTFGTLVSGTGTGVLSLTKQGTGTWTLVGSSTHTGGTTLSAGTLIAGLSSTSGTTITNGPVGTGTLNISGGTFSDNGTAITLANALNITGNMTFASTGSGSLTFDPTGLTTPTTTTIGSNLTLTVNNSTTIKEAVTATGTTTIIGTGTLTLSGANTFARIDVNSNTATLKVTGGSDALSNYFTLGSGGNGGNYIQTGGTFTVASGFGTYLSNNFGPSTFTMSGGTFTASAGGGGEGFHLGARANSTATISGTAILHMGLQFDTALASASGTGLSTYTQTGGTVDYTTGGAFIANNGGTAALTISGGSFTGGSIFYLGVRGNSTLNLSNTGTMTLTTLSLGHGVAATNNTVTLGDGINFTSGTSTLTGTSGVLIVGSVGKDLGAGGTAGTDTFNFNGGTLKASAASATFFQGVDTASVQAAGGIIDNGGFTITLAQALLHGGTATLDGGLIFQDSGTTTLSGTSTYTGITNVNAGVLRAGASTSVFGNNSAVTLANVSGAQLDLNNFNVSIGSLAGGGATGGNVTLGSGILTMGGNNTSTSYAGIISGTGGIIKSGTGTQTLIGTNTYTGGTTVSAGTLQIGTAGLLGNGSYAGSISLTGTLQYSSSAAQTLSGIISGGGALLKDTSASTLTLTGTSTFNGTTTINAGTLVVGVAGVGSIANSAVTVNSGGTLKGSGTTGAVTINSGGTISPGNSPGTLTTGSTTYNNGGTYQWEVNNATGAKGVGYDWQNISGSLTIASTAGTFPTNTFKIDITGLTAGNVSGVVPNWNPHNNYTLTLATASGGISGFASNEFTLTTTNFANNNSLGSGAFSITTSGNDLNLVFTGVAVDNAYWDINGTTAGAGGATPSGTWSTTGSNANWNFNSAGTGNTYNWNNGDNAIFSAGTDATGTFTATISGGVTAHNITVEEGNVTIAGSTLTLAGTTPTITVNTPQSLTIRLGGCGQRGPDQSRHRHAEPQRHRHLHRYYDC